MHTSKNINKLLIKCNLTCKSSWFIHRTYMSPKGFSIDMEFFTCTQGDWLFIDQIFMRKPPNRIYNPIQINIKMAISFQQHLLFPFRWFQIFNKKFTDSKNKIFKSSYEQILNSFNLIILNFFHYFYKFFTIRIHDILSYPDILEEILLFYFLSPKLQSLYAGEIRFFNKLSITTDISNFLLLFFIYSATNKTTLFPLSPLSILPSQTPSQPISINSKLSLSSEKLNYVISA